MSPAQFLELVVYPNRRDWAADHGNVRLSFNCIASVDALAARIFHWLAQTAPSFVQGVNDDSKYREELAKRSSDFRLLRDLAKAQKHGKLDRGQPLVSTANQVRAESLKWGELKWGQGRWDGSLEVMVRLDDGTHEHVEVLVDRAIEFLVDEMECVGAIK